MAGTRSSIVTLFCVALCLSGCFDQEIDSSHPLGVPIDTSSTRQVAIETASRVDQIGKQLTSCNPFLGVEPLYHTVAGDDPEICHPDSNGLFITDALVDRCRSDEELAAILAVELATMSLERRHKQQPKKFEGIQPFSDSSSMAAGGVSSDQNQVGIGFLVEQDKNSRSLQNSEELASKILENAGYHPTAIKDVEELIKKSKQNNHLARQFGSSSNRPHWTR
jgi:predicted Zn-dependent protease